MTCLKPSKISLLPEHLIDQIKAGEVIERPSSIIKELVENSIDAKSSKIDIHIVGNGMELISVADNGEGIGFEDLPYAFCRHATSKIKRFEDIYNLYSFGFRGEALASMASIGRVSCYTIPKGNLERGGKYEIHGGHEVAHVKHSGSSHGTTIYVKDIFYNTPVRMKFIKSKGAEKSSLAKLLNSFILDNPRVGFSLKWDDGEKIIFGPEKDVNHRNRFLKLFGKGKHALTDDALIHIEGEYNGYKVSAEISLNVVKGNGSVGQFIFVNGRYVEDKQLNHAVVKGMEHIWPAGTRGYYLIVLSVPPSEIDVNIHPRKTEVKFKDQSLVFSLINSSIKKSLKDSGVKPISGTAERDEDIDWSSYSGASFGSAENETVVANSNLMKQIEIGDNYFLQNKDENIVVFNKNRLVTLFFKYCFFEQHNNKRYEQIPLLVATVIDEDIDRFKNSMSFLNSLGIEISRLADNQTVIKTFPEFLDVFRNHKLIQLFFRKLVGENVLEYSSFEKIIDCISRELEEELYTLSDYQIKKMVEYIPEELLNKSNVKIVLDEDRIRKLFETYDEV